VGIKRGREKIYLNRIESFFKRGKEEEVVLYRTKKTICKTKIGIRWGGTNRGL
jgi:hypothetical protein